MYVGPYNRVWSIQYVYCLQDKGLVDVVSARRTPVAILDDGLSISS